MCAYVRVCAVCVVCAVRVQCAVCVCVGVRVYVPFESVCVRVVPESSPEEINYAPSLLWSSMYFIQWAAAS